MTSNVVVAVLKSCTNTVFASLTGLQKSNRTAAPAVAEKKPVTLLKRSSAWACIQGCGACCYLQPNERPDLEGTTQHNTTHYRNGTTLHCSQCSMLAPWFDLNSHSSCLLTIPTLLLSLLLSCGQMQLNNQ
jgi:hypothetical protein